MAKRQSARQKMINLMYLVFIAMLALNISTEVLEGFEIVNDNLKKTIDNTLAKNNQLYNDLNASYQNNPVKTQVWYDQGLVVKTKTDSLYSYIDYLKLEIAKMSDGADADVDNLEYKDNLDAAAEVLLSPNGGQGKKLKAHIDTYREYMVSRITDNQKKALIANSLSTEPSERIKRKNSNIDWLTSSFENMPSIAVLSFLTGLQANIKQAEGEVLNNLLRNIDFKDFRVNSVDVLVVPQSNYVMAGTPYQASINLAAIDTTQRPRIFINNTELPASARGKYSVGTSSPGTKSFSGYVEMMDGDGGVVKRQFKQDYVVMEPMATIAPTLMDVLYAGIDNPISISVPGVPDVNVRAVSTSGGTLQAKGKGWVARPTGQAGGKFGIQVYARVNNKDQAVAKKEFRIRMLPDPTAFINYVDASGNAKQFKRSGAISRSALLNAGGIKASIDDGILDIPFTVLSFRTIYVDAMGNNLIEMSDGAKFSARQTEQIQRIARGKFFYISAVKVKGPDGAEREISPMELRMN